MNRFSETQPFESTAGPDVSAHLSVGDYLAENANTNSELQDSVRLTRGQCRRWIKQEIPLHFEVKNPENQLIHRVQGTVSGFATPFDNGRNSDAISEITVLTAGKRAVRIEVKNLIDIPLVIN